MSEDVNVSATRSYDENTVAYAFCKFDLSPYGEIVSGIIKDQDTEYKIFIYNDGTEKILRSKIVHRSETNESDSDKELQLTDKQTIEPILNWNDDKPCEDNVKYLLEKIKQSHPLENISKDPNWITLGKQYVAIFPLRGIGSLQWTRSKKIGDKKQNYDMACDRAEIISSLLYDAEKSYIDKADGIFEFLTHPEIFKFEVSKREKRNENEDEKFIIKVIHNEVSVDLLKISEGILEARITSLLLAIENIKTLCLEDPDRGMHPQMIERLKTVLYQRATNKTIIVVTHSPYLIDTVTISRTHLFFRKKEEKDMKYGCSALHVGKELTSLSDMETIRTLLFATKVLLVKGVSEKEVVQIILNKHSCKTLGESKASRDKVTHLSTYQVIAMGGYKNAEKIQSFCKQIDLPCLCLMDRGTAVKVHDHKVTSFTYLEGEEMSDFKKYLGKELSAFISCEEDFIKFSQILESKKNVFIWRYGTVEDAILSSGSINDGIAKALNILNAKILKDKIKERLSEEERDRFYNELLKIEEIQRFIRFLQKEEISQ